MLLYGAGAQNLVSSRTSASGRTPRSCYLPEPAPALEALPHHHGDPERLPRDLTPPGRLPPMAARAPKQIGEMVDDRRRRCPSRPKPGRHRADRALHVEGDPRLLHLHRVRSLLGQLPGAQDRQDPHPEAAHARSARPPLRARGRVPRSARAARRAPTTTGTRTRDGTRRRHARPRADGHARRHGTTHEHEHGHDARARRARARRSRAPRAGVSRRTRSRSPEVDVASRSTSSPTSSTPTCSGPARPAAPAKSSAR